MQSRCENEAGLTLVEVMMALLILLLVFTGLFQTALLSIDHNMRNILRDEAVKVAAMQMQQEENQPFAALVSSASSIPAGSDCPGSITTGQVIQRNFRNMSKDFCLSEVCVDLDGDGDCASDDAASNTKQLTVTVGWRWKGEDFTHTVRTLRRR